MKVKVTRKFIDKYSGLHHVKGDVLDITEERYNEIMSVGNLVVKIAQDDAGKPIGRSMMKNIDEAEETPTNDSDASSDGFDVMSVRELKEYADKAHKLTFGRGTKKAEMIETLRRMERGE